eukprot:TRINITY_DN3189_c0_g1_i4.p2 TRINITY_DN3189_c0_g1~~TRINITY_DN3189_c0_g1_i4.p2  ORF type:complete len:306 (-),score=12.87 TRINITY_DN3189_c0_g1_i4:530-1447(-)
MRYDCFAQNSTPTALATPPSPETFEFVQTQAVDNCLDLCQQENGGPVCCSGQQYSNLCSAQCELPISEFQLCIEQPCQAANIQTEPCLEDNEYKPVCCNNDKVYDNLCEASKVLGDTSGCTDGECEGSRQNQGCKCQSNSNPVCCQGNLDFVNWCFAQCQLGSTFECKTQPCEKACECQEGEDINAFAPVCCLFETEFKNKCLARCELGTSLADSIYICIDGACAGEGQVLPSPSPDVSPSPVENIRNIEEIRCDNFPTDVCIPCAPGTLLPNYFFDPQVRKCQPKDCCNFGAFFSNSSCTEQCG